MTTPRRKILLQQVEKLQSFRNLKQVVWQTICFKWLPAGANYANCRLLRAVYLR